MDKILTSEKSLGPGLSDTFFATVSTDLKVPTSLHLFHAL